MTIITTRYRYKRPPRKRKQNQAALAMPKIVHAKTPKPGLPPRIKRAGEPKPAPDAPANDDRKSAIVTARSRKHVALSAAPNPTAENHKQRGDAAAALFREMVRRVRDRWTHAYFAIVYYQHRYKRPPRKWNISGEMNLCLTIQHPRTPRIKNTAKLRH